MHRTVFLLSLLSAVEFTLQDRHDDLIQAISNFFDRRHVQTIVAATCWSSDVNARLLKRLSAMDKSSSFCLSELQTHATWYRHGYVVDLSCSRSSDFMHKISNDRIFNLQNDWVLFGGQSISSANDTPAIALDVFNAYLGRSYVLPDSEVFLFQEIENGVWEIWNGFRASKWNTIRVFKVGMTSRDRLEIDDLIRVRTNFGDVELKASTVILESDGFKGFNQTVAVVAGLDVFSYMHYPMIKVLADQLNFNFSMTVTNSHGWPYDNGSFFGLIGILQREESDFGAAATLMRLDRMKAVDFTVGTVSFESNILFKQPKLSSVTNIHIRPFKYEVWLMILLLFVVFVAIMITLNKFKASHQHSLTTLDIVGLVHGAICQQGTSNTLNVISLKLIVFVLFSTTFFMFIAYSASIVSLFQTSNVSIKNVKDIVNEESMKINIQISPYAKPYFNETTDSTLRTFYDIKIKPHENTAFTDTSMGIEKIRTGFFGFMVEKTSAYREINNKWREDEKCGLSEVQLLKLPVLGIPVTKRSGHKDVFKQKLIQQQEVGIKKRFVELWTPQKPSCNSMKKNKNYVSVSIKEMLPTLKLFGYGILIAVALFICELTYHAFVDYANDRQQVHETNNEQKAVYRRPTSY